MRTVPIYDPAHLHQRYLHSTFFYMNDVLFELHTYVGYPQQEDVNDSKDGRDKVPLPISLLICLLQSNIVLCLGLEEPVGGIYF